VSRSHLPKPAFELSSDQMPGVMYQAVRTTASTSSSVRPTARSPKVPVLPVGIAYTHPVPRPCDRAAVCIGAPMRLGAAGRERAVAFTAELAAAMAAISCSSGSTTPHLRQSAFMQRMEQAGSGSDVRTRGSNQPKPRTVRR
jgi:hypothetical protein